MKNKYTILISNTTIFAIGNLLVKLIAFFLMPLYTVLLTTEQYGVAELLNSTIEIVLPIVTLCIIEALYRFSIDEEMNRKMLFTNAAIIIIIGDLVVLGGCVIWRNIFNYQYAYYFFALFFSTTFYKLTTQFARGLGHVKRYALYGVLNSLVLVLANVLLLVYLRGGIEAYLSSFTIGFGVSGIICVLFSKEWRYLEIQAYDLSLMKVMLKYSMPSIPNMLSWWVNSLSDRYIILLYWGAGITGLYTAASKLPAMINMVTAIFQQAWQYSTAIEIGAEDNRTFFSDVLRGYTYICVIICSCLVEVNKLICKILLKESFYTAWKFVPLLLLAATFGCLSTYFGTFYNATKKNFMLMVSTIVGAVVNLILNFIFIPQIGAIGAAIATVVSYALIVIIRIIDVTKIVTLDICIKRIAFQFTVLIFEVIVGSIVASSVAELIGGICIGILVLSDWKLLIELKTKGLCLLKGNVKEGGL